LIEDRGSRFSTLAPESSGSEAKEEGIPFEVAQMALDGESDNGWMPVTKRKHKMEAETVVDF
jgi:hypothetical protein